MYSFTADLSKKCGVEEAKVQTLLDQLGLSSTLTELNRVLPSAHADEIKLDHIRLSLRVGNMQIAR